MEIAKTFVAGLSSLKSYYRFENGAFTTDSGTSAKTLTNNGTVAEGAGKYGVGADFGASNSSKYFTASDSSYLPTSDFTYSLWFKTTITSTGTWIICDNNGGGAGITLRMNSNTNIQARIMQNGGTVGDLNISSLAAFNDDNWHHVVFTRTGTAMALYLDNVSIGTGTSTGNPNFSAAKNLYIGAYFNGSQDFVSGTLDDIAILSVGVTADVVDLLYRSKSYVGEYKPSTNTKGYYPLSSITDFTSNANVLTNNNTVGFAAGKFNNCADFGTSNTNKSLSRADGLGIDLSATATVNCWVKIRGEPATNASYTIVDLRSTTGTAGRMIFRYVDVSGTKRLYLDRTTTPITYDVTLGTTNWHMLTAVYTASNHYIYLNGVQVASGGAGNSNAGNSLNIGGQAGAFANAYIDEVVIENVAWSATTIRKHYAWSTGRYL